MPPLLCLNWNFTRYLFMQFEDAAREVADEVTRPRPEGDEDIQDIQVMIRSAAHPTCVRALKVRIFVVVLMRLILLR